MKIGTFGSCLSRGIAERYVEAFGGKILTSVYHNRTDQFLDVFVKKVAPEPTLDVLMHLANVTAQDEGAEFDEVNILKNQVRATMGKHLLSAGVPFLDAIAANSLDILLIDNFIDVSAALKVGTVDDKAYRFFTRVRTADGNALELIPKMDPEVSATGTTELVQFIRSHSPRTRIIFSVFPWNTYPDASGRKQWTETFQRRLLIDVEIIPAIEVPPAFHIEGTPSHFRKDFYFVYAGMVNHILTRTESEQVPYSLAS